MLNKEQLLKIQKDIEEKSKIDCKNKEYPNYKELIETALMYRGMIENLQFVENSGQIGGAIYKFCPICGNANIKGHKRNCQLAKLLK